MTRLPLAAIAAVLAFVAGTAAAQMWEAYSPSKEVWDITQIRVEPTKLDDYLAGLKQTWVPAEEISKKRGDLLDYKILVSKTLDTRGANVILLEEYASAAALEPNRDRDLSIRAEQLKILPKDKLEAQGESYAKWRAFVDEGHYFAVEFSK